MAVTADGTTGGVTAEESAQEAARRIRADAERRARASRAASGGARADGRSDPGTTAALASLPPSWSALRTGADPRLRHVEAVAVGPGGVFVVGSADAAGAPEHIVRPAPDGEVAARLSRAAALVSRLAGASSDVVHPVLCRSSDQEVGGVVDDVLVCSPATLVRTLTDRPRTLSPATVAATSLRLEARLRTSSGAGAPARPELDTPAAVGGGGGGGSAPPPRVLVQVLVALLLFAALLFAGAQVADRMDVLPAPSRDTGPAGR